MPIIKYDIKELCTLPPPYGGVTVYVKRLIGQLFKDGFTVGGYYSKSCSDKGIINSPMFDKWTWMQTGLLPIKIWKYLIETASYKIVHSHFSLEGMAYLEWFDGFLSEAKKRGAEFYSLEKRAEELSANRAALPVCEIEMSPFPGRSGLLAVQKS